MRGTAAGEGFEARIFLWDVAEPASVEQAVQDTLAQLGVIDILVNNAGVSGPTLPTWEYPLEEWGPGRSRRDLTSVFFVQPGGYPGHAGAGGRPDRERGVRCGQGGQRETRARIRRRRRV